MEDLEDGWTVHVAPTGHNYYYNAETKKSTYKKPIKSLKTSDVVQHEPTSRPDPSILASTIEGSSRNVKKTTKLTTHEERAKLPGDRPKSKMDISGCEPWVKVITRFGRHFYHNPDTNESVWRAPQNISEAVAIWEKEQLEDTDYSSDSEHSENHESEAYDEEVLNDNEKAPEYDEEDIAWQLAAMEEAGQTLPALEEGPDYTLEEKTAIFTKMLYDNEVDPFATWDAELSKFIADPRYLIFDNTRQRKAVFEDFCAQKAKEVQLSRENVVRLDPRISFLSIARAGLAKQMYFQDFKRKFKRDMAYKAFGSTDHEREKLYRSLQDKSKLPLAQREAMVVDFLQSTSADSLRADERYYLLDEDRIDALKSKYC